MKNKRLWCLGLAGVMIVSACGCGKSVETVEETSQTAEESSQAAEIAEKAVSRSAGKEAEKEETVYVNADASGEVKSITVSSWLKNGTGAEEITDVTELTDVVNVKGDETYTQDGDTYVWAADGNDIYYQGETSKELPVDVKVTYYLNDEEIAPAELAGKSGRVKIRFDYENLTSQQAVIGGEETTLCVPFVAASTLILDSDKFVNVEVENGKILSDGKNTIVAGVAMPGLYDSLDLLNLEGFEDIDIPEYVEVTADVTDFELAMTATILMPDVLSELDTDDMDGFDDLKDDIEELNDATYELIDGCIELDDGVQELKDNMPDLWDGVVELDDGAWELDDGAQELLDGADELNDGAAEIRDGAKELDNGAGTLQAGIGLLNDKVPALTGGVTALAGGLQKLQSSMMLGPDGQSGSEENPYIVTSVGQLEAGVDSLVSGIGNMSTQLTKAIQQNTAALEKAQEQVKNSKKKLDTAIEEKEEIEKKLDELANELGFNSSEDGTDPDEGGTTEDGTESGTGESSGTAEDGSVTMPGDGSGATPGEDGTLGDGAGAESGDGSAAAPGGGTGAESGDGSAAAQESAETAGAGQTAGADGNPGASSEKAQKASESESDAAKQEESDSGDTSGTEAVSEQSEFVTMYLESLIQSDGMTPMGMVQLTSGEDGTNSGDSEETMKACLDLVNLQTKLIGKLEEIIKLQEEQQNAESDLAKLQGRNEALQTIASQLGSTDTTQLTEGMAALKISVGKIYEMITLINTEMDTLTGGAAQLGQGIGALKDGSDALKAGTKKLYEGGKELKKGTGELYEGTQELKDGTEELVDGTGELKDGVVDLIDGVDELKDGTTELLDGVYEYNEDGIQKLYETVTVDLQNLLDRVDAIADLSEGYQSFSGKSDAMEGSVKFIIETEAIELDED